MNRVILLLLLVILGVNGWLVRRQGQLERQIDSLRAENVRLSGELAQKPDLSAETFEAVSRRLENATAFMNAVEGRLTDASELLSQLQNLSQRMAVTARSGPTMEDLGTRRRYSAEGELGRPEMLSEPLPSTPASSHSPDGLLLQRNWGPEQVVGPPNTAAAGDYPTAWAQRTSRGGPAEWLQVNYDRPVEIAEVRVRETYNPGAIARLAALLPSGQEMTLWEGRTPLAEAPLDTSFPLPPGVQAQSVKIYLDRTRAPGWNEIDAVELIGRDGSRQWAASATASSTYASQSWTIR